MQVATPASALRLQRRHCRHVASQCTEKGQLHHRERMLQQLPHVITWQQVRYAKATSTAELQRMGRSALLVHCVKQSSSAHVSTMQSSLQFACA